MDTTEVTAVTPKHRGVGVRRRLARALPDHARLAQWMLPVAAFLFGAMLSAVVFVGVWRHTASQGAQEQAARATADRRLTHALAVVTGLKAELTGDRKRLARARTSERTLAASLASLRRSSGAVADRLPGQLTEAGTTAAALERRSASLASALASLQAYVANSSGSNFDPGFLGTQIRYLAGSSQNTHDGVARLQAQLGQAAQTASRLRSSR